MTKCNRCGFDPEAAVRIAPLSIVELDAGGVLRLEIANNSRLGFESQVTGRVDRSDGTTLIRLELRVTPT